MLIKNQDRESIVFTHKQSLSTPQHTNAILQRKSFRGRHQSENLKIDPIREGEDSHPCRQSDNGISNRARTKLRTRRGPRHVKGVSLVSLRGSRGPSGTHLLLPKLTVFECSMFLVIFGCWASTKVEIPPKLSKGACGCRLGHTTQEQCARRTFTQSPPPKSYIL